MKIQILLVITAYLASADFISDVTQIYNAINNGGNILKALHKKQNPIQYAAITDTIEYHCANPTKQFTRVYYNDNQMTTKLDIKAHMVFIIGGWHSSGTEEWAIKLSQEWINHYYTNVCRVRYTRYSQGRYDDVAMYQIRTVAKLVTMFIEKLKSTYQMKYEDVTLAGHSLGGQLSGFIGQNLKSQIGYIYGLDPAGPLFTVPIVLPIKDRLDASDAKLVVVIHSCDGLFGVSIACGHKDLYPNYGTYPQPGCIWPFQKEIYSADGLSKFSSSYCSHARAIQYLVEMIKHNSNCIGLNCSNEKEYSSRRCRGGAERLGIYQRGKPGKYYFETSYSKCNGKY